MIITKLDPDGKQKVRIDLDGEYAFFLYAKEVRRLQLEEGSEVSGQLVNDIYQLILYPRAKEKALSLLKYRNRTRKELEDKLIQAGYPDTIVDSVLKFMEEYGFINDIMFVRSYIEIQGKKKSRMQLIQDLGRKGISKEMFQNIWEERPDGMEEQVLRELVEKRVRTKGPVTKDNFQKYYGHFARKGYPSSQIVKLLKEFQKFDERENF